MLSLATDEAQLAAVKKALEADGRRLYEKTLGGAVSMVKLTSGVWRMRIHLDLRQPDTGTSKILIFAQAQ